MNIDKIMNMLDWNNDEKVQEEGRKLASEIQDLKIFMRPIDENNSKNIWDNCALVISAKTDEILKPYIPDMLEWLKDLTWPGTLTILARLQEYKDYSWLSLCLRNSIKTAMLTDHYRWIRFMSYLLENEVFWEYLEEDVLDILKKYYYKNT